MSKRYSKRVREEAEDLLAYCASQGDRDLLTTHDAPGHWSESTRELAGIAWAVAVRGGGYWREHYAEAESLLRTGWTP